MNNKILTNIEKLHGLVNAGLPDDKPELTMQDIDPYTACARELNILNYCLKAGLPDVKLNEEYPGVVAHFDLLKAPKSDSDRNKLVLKLMDLMQGMDFEKVGKTAYYFNFGNTERSYGIIGIMFDEFPGSRTGAHKREFEYLQNRGMIHLEIVTPLEPHMKNDERYTKPIDVDYA